MGSGAADADHRLGLSGGRVAARLGAAAARRRGPPLIALGVAGWSGSGKTTLIERVLPLLRIAGLRVSTIKHTHHTVDLDPPGKDSHRHRLAGAEEVMVASAARFALLRETSVEASLPDLLARLAPVDLVLVEGFKHDDFPKLEVYRPALNKPPLWPDRPGIVAVATDAPPPVPCRHPLLPLNDAAAIVTWMLGFGGFAARTA